MTESLSIDFFESWIRVKKIILMSTKIFPLNTGPMAAPVLDNVKDLLKTSANSRDIQSSAFMTQSTRLSKETTVLSSFY